nr:MFS transporter [Nakamurella deserti]
MTTIVSSAKLSVVTTHSTTPTTPSAPAKTGLLHQPKSVWAVAFACVIAFMGIGLVDPILPTLREDLGATPSQISLLFTSYLFIMAFAMVFSGWVSSRLGPKRTLLAGLAMVVVFSALAGSSDTIGAIVGFRAGWGLGNALFVGTALAVIVGAASGGIGGAIILYESALGIGIATGPLVGGLLGDISWRGPFFGVAVLMALAFVATVVLLGDVAAPTRRYGLLEPFRALRHPGLAVIAVVAFFYNVGFFTLLAYAPYPMEMSALALGWVFFGWGVLVAVSSVWVAPIAQRRLGTHRSLAVIMGALTVILVVMALGVDSPATLATCVVVSGLFSGCANTLVTQTVMVIAPVDRPIASAGYSFVRFMGGAIAPFVATKLAEHLAPAAAFWFGAAGFVVAAGVAVGFARQLAPADAATAHDAAPRTSADATALAEATAD